MTERVIDSRYPPLSHASVRVPLYPGQLPSPGVTETHIETTLIESLATNLEIPSNTLTIGNSASALVREFLSHSSESSDNRLVAVPHYSCQSLVDAIIEAGARPVFYDIEEDATVSERGVQFALAAGSTTFIWPAYFGSSERDDRLVGMLQESNIPIIFDDAQANFFSSTAQQTRDALAPKDVVLYSFGMSKLLAGSGGGALYSAVDNEVVSILRDSLSSQASVSTDEVHVTLSKRFNTQLELLEARDYQGAQDSKITKSNAYTTLKQLEKHLESRTTHIERYEVVKEVIVGALGETALRFVKATEGAPTILAIEAPNARRYELLANLSSEGIQSTWYYHPINRVSRYRRYISQDDQGAAAVANSMVVLPFQWTHTTQQVECLIGALLKIGAINAF